MSSFAAFGTQSNPQQNPGFQQQQSTMYAAQRPATPGWEPQDEQEPAGMPQAAPARTGAPSARPRNPGPSQSQGGMAPAPEPTSPVSANGKLSTMPATPWGQPAGYTNGGSQQAGAYTSVFRQPLRAPVPKNAPRQQTTASATNSNEQVLGLYQKNFGRSASAQEAQHWVQQSGGGGQLSPEQLAAMDQQFQKEPEFAQYQGQRPNLQPGQFIPGVTLGTTLDNDPSNPFPTQAPSDFTPQAMAARPDNTTYQGYDFGEFLRTQAAPQYQGSEFSQFQAPNQGGVEQAGLGLVQSILDQPDAVSQDQINQTKAQQQEVINGRMKEASAGQASALAARGLSARGGTADAGNRRMQENAASTLAKSYRDIDLEAANLNTASRRDATGIASDYLSGQTGRATSGYGATLAGQGARAGDARAVAASGQDTADFTRQGQQFTFGQQQARADDRRAAAGSANANWNTDQGLGLNRDQFGFQAYMGQRGLDQDQNRIDNNAEQFNKGLNLDFMKFLESKFQGREGLRLDGQRVGNQAAQFDKGLGLNYDQLNTEREMGFYNWLQRQQG